MCESRSSMTSWPLWVWATTATRLPIVPEVTSNPASLPSRAAAVASRRWTVGSSPHTSSPTSARAIASRISGVGSVMVSDRRSTMSCTIGLLPSRAAAPGVVAAGDRAKSLGAAPAPLGEPVLARQLTQQVDRLALLALHEIDLGQRVERLRNDQGAGVLLEHELQALPGRAGVALIEIVPRDPHFLLSQLATADVDLGQAIGGVAAVGILLDELLELLDRLDGQSLVLLDRLELIVVAHSQPVPHQVCDLVARVEGQERLELLHRLVELGLAVERLADQEPGPGRPRRVGMTLDDLAEGLACLDVAPALELPFTLGVQLVRRKDRRRR